jgi:hypothetical protein
VATPALLKGVFDDIVQVQGALAVLNPEFGKGKPPLPPDVTTGRSVLLLVPAAKPAE